MKRFAAGAFGALVVVGLGWIAALAAFAQGGGVAATERRAAAPSAAPASDPRRSGFDAMTPELRAMQQDDASNPGTLWVKDGEALWNRVDGPAAKACTACHGDAAA